jgi:uncharacterized protein YdhG (YjbR/CyaY superfamily)
MQSKATTVDAYLAGLPQDRRSAVKKVRALLTRRMPKGYRETMGHGMITYMIPLEHFPETYNGQPLLYAALASQKNYLALYLMGPYSVAALRKKLEAGFARAGKKLDMGKACIRFQSAEDLPLDVIGDVVAAVPPGKYLEAYRKSREGRARR